MKAVWGCLEVRTNTYAQKVIRQVNQKGTYVNGTNEIVGFTDKLIISDSFWSKRSGADVEGMQLFFEEVLSRNEKCHFGPYDSMYYTFLVDEILSASAQFVIDGPNTRRAIITFPREHCFTSIQLLVRPGTFNDPGHKCSVLVSMRSCNVIDNFANDLYLAYLISQEVLKHGFGTLHGIKTDSMRVNIGSLHRIIIN